MKKVIIPLANGCEELEAITLIDLLRRAEIEVVSVSLDEGTQVKAITASRGNVITADKTLDQVLSDNFDMIILPGGLPGADYLDQNTKIQQLIMNMYQQGSYIAAICAAPKVLLTAGLLKNQKFTCYPGSINISAHQDDLLKNSTRLDNDVVQSGQIITSKGPATAIPFALRVISLLLDKATAQKIANDILYTNNFLA